MAKTPVMLRFCFTPSRTPRSCTKKSLILSMITITTADAPRQQLTRKCERCSSACCREILSFCTPLLRRVIHTWKARHYQAFLVFSSGACSSSWSARDHPGRQRGQRENAFWLDVC